MITNTHKPSKPNPSLKRSIPSQEVEFDDDSDSDQDVLKQLKKNDPEAYHRERRRRNQERYRKRQRTTTTNLESDNNQLRDEIEKLERQRNTLSYGVATKETIWSVAAEYFRVFRRGLQMPNGELDFLRATMTADLDAGTVIGLEALARNWRVFTEFFQGVQMQLGRLDQIAERSVVATTTLSATVSRLTLHNMFPHLVSGKKSLSSIANRLLGHRLVIRVAVRFDWDEANNRVVSVISQGDMVTPVLQVLGCLNDVSLVFSKSRIKPDGNLVIGDYLSQYTLSY
ncbi:hypothetical protein PHMEG_00010559 [Phytophthora megakarya]|uniref:BZIP domain-containing protein n=1 Tax=Phytophthora megakarya TaxID=4795 RepID=A0A225WDY2_9STRA|nr:hypothetical protein PHMEG_00010559 [Phytophthora megakarya]